MRYRIESKSKMSAYMQLYLQLKEDIVKGVYPYMSKLPSKRLLSEEMQISVITVSHSLDLLCEEGYVESRERSGYFVVYRSEDFLESDKYIKRKSDKKINKTFSADTLENAEMLKDTVDQSWAYTNNRHENISNIFRTNNLKQIDRVVAHNVGELSFSMLAKTMRRTLLDYGETILKNSPNKGLLEFREELASYLSRNRGIFVDPSQIIIGSGAEYLYSLIAQLFDKSITIAVEDPCYKKIPQVYEAMGNRVEYLKMGENGIKSEELQRTKAGILHVTPFHSYPSNITADISKKNEYLKWAKEHGYIVEDNYDSEITISSKMEDSLYTLDQGQRVIYMNTFSKTIAASLRIGYMVLPISLVNAFDQKLGFYSCTVPAYEQLVITELLKSGEFERHINRVRRKLRNDNKR